MMKRSRLTISSAGSDSLGPLSVAVFPETGEPIEFALASGCREHTVKVPPGRYAVVASRPNGDRLRRSVTVAAGQPVRIAFAEDLSDPPNEFMVPEVMRGEITRLSRLAGAGSVVVPGGFVAQDLKSIAAVRMPKDFLGAGVSEQSMFVRVWNLAGRGASASILADHDLDEGSPFLKVRIRSGCLAVGLVDRDGFGPIVMTPPFQEPLDVTFLAEGVATRAAVRSLNPSGRPVPVALANPMQPILADFLSAISCPAFERAEQVWEHNVGGLADIERALRCASGELACPAEVLLAAHYLLRFLPDRLPLGLADNLMWALPEAADGPVIAAWLYLSSGADEVRAIDRDAIDRRVSDLLAVALSRRIALFSRTRRLLTKALRLESEAQHWLMGSREAVATLGPERFSIHGAHAGGLEAFWGTGPFSPGPQGTGSTGGGHDIARATLRGTEFVRTDSVSPTLLTRPR